MRPDASGSVRIAARIQELVETGQLKARACQHLSQINDVSPSIDGCEECLKSGDRWVHLRLCLTCGHVGCCDDSKNKHASQHYHTTNHPLIASFEPNENWVWCFTDQAVIVI